MATTDLSFKQEGGSYKAAFTSQGEAVVQVQRKGVGELRVLAALEGMSPSTVFPFADSANGRENIIFRLDIPSGVSVEIVSGTEVVSAKMMAL